MKRLIICLLALLLLTVPASAHPGGTDSSGGHYDHDTGEYHYHHGYPAHQHEDLDGDGDLDCPYDFDDQTGRNSGSSTSSGGSTTIQTPTRETQSVKTDSTNKPEGKGLGLLGTIGLTIAIIYLVWYGIAFIGLGLHNLWKWLCDWFSGCLPFILGAAGLGLFAFLMLLAADGHDIFGWLDGFGIAVLMPLGVMLGFVIAKDFLIPFIIQLIDRWWDKHFSDAPQWYTGVVQILLAIIAVGLIVLWIKFGPLSNVG